MVSFADNSLHVSVRQGVTRPLSFKALGCVDGINALLKEPVADLEALPLLLIFEWIGESSFLNYEAIPLAYGDEIEIGGLPEML